MVLLALIGCNLDKESRACSHVADMFGPLVNSSNREHVINDCRMGTRRLRSFRGEDAYQRHLDCILASVNLDQALPCDNIY
jgi:hypothetical protein